MSEILMKTQDNTLPEDEENLNEISNINKNKGDEEANLDLDNTKDDELQEDKNTIENTIETATVENESEPDDLNPNIVVIDCKEILKRVEEFKEV